MTNPATTELSDLKQAVDEVREREDHLLALLDTQVESTESSPEYNGWPNYATWRVATLLFEHRPGLLALYCQQILSHGKRLQETRTRVKAENLMFAVREWLLTSKNASPYGDISPYGDLMYDLALHALPTVRWEYIIAKALFDLEQKGEAVQQAPQSDEERGD